MTRGERAAAGALRGVVRLLRALGPVRASNLGGWLARTVGPRLPVSRIAYRNLELALPALGRAEHTRIVRGMWDNLGRTTAEFPHLGRLMESEGSGPGWSVEQAEIVDGLQGSAILVSGHLCNWEVMLVAAARHGVDMASFYRAADNTGIDGIINGLRQDGMGPGAKMFPKGGAGARQALGHLRHGGVLGILADQKMNDGIEARWFGRPAMTAPALAVLALRIRCPVIPVYVVRTGPARLRVVCEPPLPLPDTGDKAADVLALTQAVNDRLEAWVRARPEDWLWVHRRWAKALYR